MNKRDILEVDVLFVGAGASSLSSAIHLAQLIEAHNKASGEKLEPMIAVIEKAAEIGSHQLSGAVLDPQPLKDLFPNFIQDGCPVEAEVGTESFYFLTKEKAFKSPLMPPPMKNHGNYVISLSRLTRWLGEQAEALGINIFTGFTGKEVIIENDRVCGVITGDQGIDAKGEKKANFESGVEIRAKCTIFGEGVRGYLSKQLISKLNLDRNAVNPQTFETSVKEIWECPQGRIEPGMVIHTAGYPLDNGVPGGSFIYGMKDNLLALGLVVSLNYENTFVEPHLELQKFKAHPKIQEYISGGKSIGYGAKALTSGGFYAMPQLYFNGGMFVGESGGLLDMARLKGIHVGMRSGILAAKTIFDQIKNSQNFDASDLQPYQQAFLNAREGRDLYKSRNFHQAVSKGMPTALFHLGLQQLTGGRGLIDPMKTKKDRDHYLTVKESPGRYGDLNPKEAPSFVDKLTSVYQSGTIHEEDQPAHLKIGNTHICYDTCEDTYKAPCNRFCPASVYEMQRGGDALKLQINFTNCVHCQTCDIKCPFDNISWTPPESGGGPKYDKM